MWRTIGTDEELTVSRLSRSERGWQINFSPILPNKKNQAANSAIIKYNRSDKTHPLKRKQDGNKS